MMGIAVESDTQVANESGKKAGGTKRDTCKSTASGFVLLFLFTFRKSSN